MELAIISLIAAVTFYIMTRALEVLAKLDAEVKAKPTPKPNAIGFITKKETNK